MGVLNISILDKCVCIYRTISSLVSDAVGRSNAQRLIASIGECLAQGHNNRRITSGFN